jgi:hypothetical protein
MHPRTRGNDGSCDGDAEARRWPRTNARALADGVRGHDAYKEQDLLCICARKALELDVLVVVQPVLHELYEEAAHDEPQDKRNGAIAFCLME